MAYFFTYEYRAPRAILDMGRPIADLVLSDAAAKAVAEMVATTAKPRPGRSEKTLAAQFQSFIARFGVYLPCRLHLGGKYVAEQSRQFSSQAEADKAQVDFAVAANAKINLVSATVKNSTHTETETQEKSSAETASLHVYAVGGDAASDRGISGWLSSLSKAQAWGVWKTERIIPIYDLFPTEAKSAIIPTLVNGLRLFPDDWQNINSAINWAAYFQREEDAAFDAVR